MAQSILKLILYELIEVRVDSWGTARGETTGSSRTAPKRIATTEILI
jgi:hypothetical protein